MRQGDNQSKFSFYATRRGTLFWALTIGGMVVVGFLLYKELSTPLVRSVPTSIADAAPPKTEPPTAEARARHTVPATYPKYLLIPKLHIDTNIYTVGVTKGGAIDAPQTAWSVGWYSGSSLPGTGSGAAFIDGHVNDAFNTPGIFYKLSALLPGDEVAIVRGDDSRLHYEVVKVSEEPLKGLDMRQALSSIAPGKEGLNLITCGGIYDTATKTYTNRIVVYAVRAD